MNAIQSIYGVLLFVDHHRHDTTLNSTHKDTTNICICVKRGTQTNCVHFHKLLQLEKLICFFFFLEYIDKIDEPMNERLLLFIEYMSIMQ